MHQYIRRPHEIILKYSFRSETRIHAHISEAERPLFGCALAEQVWKLNSGALDRSAILTAGNRCAYCSLRHFTFLIMVIKNIYFKLEKHIRLEITQQQSLPTSHVIAPSIVSRKESKWTYAGGSNE